MADINECKYEIWSLFSRVDEGYRTYQESSRRIEIGKEKVFK